MGNILWSILNIFILIIIGWPVAFLCCGAYITISPFAACFGSGCDAITDVLQKGVQWPRGLGAAIANGDSSMGCWLMNAESWKLFLHFCWDYYFILYWLTVRIVNDNCLSYRRYAFLIKKSNFESWDNDNTYMGWTTDDLGVFPLSSRPNLSCLQTMTGWFSGKGIISRSLNQMTADRLLFADRSKFLLESMPMFLDLHSKFHYSISSLSWPLVYSFPSAHPVTSCLFALDLSGGGMD